MVSPLIAANAYAAVQGAAGSSLAGPAASAAGPDFGQMVNSAISDAMNASRTAETQMAAQVQGKANLVDVVTAISSAETSLNTVLAIRDQVISAYQEIMRTNI
ncbi:MAG: flagellar hook-basal body complex protein FliE [Caulobacterales bacterium]